MSEQKKTRIRWFILSLLFVATTLLYIDRAALGIMAPYLQEQIGWTERQYGYITSSFMIGYAICFLLMGHFIDRTGTRKGYAISVGLWSVAQLAHSLVSSWVGFAVSRFGLSIGQSGNFPVSIKAVAEWFPKKERALAVGLFNGGANVGTMVAPLVIPVVVLLFDSWRAAFVWTFPLSLVWIVCWLKFYSGPGRNRRVNRAELDYILSDAEEATTEKVSYGKLLGVRATWAILAGKFIADPVWWFYLFWGAKYLHTRFGLNLSEIGLPFFAIYSVSWGGGIMLGWLSSRLLKTGSLNRGRKFSMLACAVCALPVMLVPHTGNLWAAVALIALAAGGHCGWSANIFSLMSDVFPKKVTASISGLGGFAGAMGGFIAPILIGASLEGSGVDGYAIPFTVAAFAYFFALGVIHWLVPHIRPIKM
ncbi:MAG: MFS transporter [Tannerella sp.]|jgi:ACS family hexuronate transporter-like MFS transporter|nr:MFS transporter [Tannerella sp.]